MVNAQHEVLLDNQPSELNKPPLRKQRSFSASFWRIVRKWWLLELSSVLIGMVSTIALCKVLKKYDNNAAPNPSKIVGIDVTLNTLVSVLSTISRAALLLAVSECISQLKWIWYLNKYRPLEDLDVFNDASRGAWGGLKLLWKINIRQIASLGALLIIAGLAVDPLSQQLVHYNVRDVQSVIGNASIPACIEWNDDNQNTNSFEGFSVYGIPSPPLPMKAAIQNGLYAGTSVVDDMQPVCSSGNCTWPNYRSLAICAKSANVTSSLKTQKVSIPGSLGPKSEDTVNQYYLSQNNYLTDDGTVLFNSSSVARSNPILDNYSHAPISLNFSNSIAFQNSSLPIADVFMIYSTSRTDSDGAFAAMEFVLEWCVQEFTTSVTNGSSSTQRQVSFSNFSKPDPANTGVSLTTSPNDGDNRVYTVDPGTHYILQNYLRGLFEGYTSLPSSNSDAAQLFTSSDATQALFQPFDIFGEIINGVNPVAGQGGGPSDLQKILDNVATSMTNIIRSNYNSTSTTSPDGASHHEAIQGTIYQPKTFVEVQWGWIAAPIVLLIGSLIFVLATIILSSGFGRRQKPGIWKSSNLPLLKAFGDGLQKQSSTGIMDMGLMEEWAKHFKVRLERRVGEEGWKLLGYESEK